MNLTPLKVYRAPDYPTQEILCQRPELLRTLPRRWHNNRLVLGTLAGILALMEQSNAKAEDQPALRVAPVFEHGKGQGAYGCVVVTPPVFLTEAEARDVIEEEAKKAGVEFAERGHKLSAVPVPFVEKFVVWEGIKPDAPPVSGTNSDGSRWSRFGGDPAQRFQKKGPVQTREMTRDEEVKLTGWNSQKQIGYRFVTRENFEARRSDSVVPYEKLPDGTLKRLYGSWIGSSSASDYDVHGAAERLRKGLKNVKEPGTVGVFYDPLASPSKPPEYPFWVFPRDGRQLLTPEEIATRDKAFKEYHEAYDAAGKQISVEELRRQVRDFLAWLKAQGLM